MNLFDKSSLIWLNLLLIKNSSHLQTKLFLFLLDYHNVKWNGFNYKRELSASGLIFICQFSLKTFLLKKTLIPLNQ